MATQPGISSFILLTQMVFFSLLLFTSSAQHYPSLFITVSENDQRIPLEGVLRYICKLRRAVRDHVQAKSTDEKGNFRNFHTYM